jgi:predicted dehydrogenase
MSETSRYRIAVIGAGAIGGTHIDVLSANTAVQLVAICDSDRDAAVKAAQKAGARAFTSYREMILEEKLDGVILCTPPISHHTIVEDLIAHGIDVLCEKPFAVDGARARHMLERARSHGRLVMLASKFRYVDDVRWAREIIRSGKLGTIRHAEIVFTSKLDMQGKWHTNRAISGGGVIIDNGSHAVDLSRFLFGPIESTMGVSYAQGQDLPVEDSACIQLLTETGPQVTIDVSWSFQRDLPYFLRVQGSTGDLTVGWKESVLALSGGTLQKGGSGYSKTLAFAALHDDFIRASRGLGSPAIDEDDALAAVDVVDATYLSMENGRVTRLEELQFPIAAKTSGTAA